MDMCHFIIILYYKKTLDTSFWFVTSCQQSSDKRGLSGVYVCVCVRVCVIVCVRVYNLSQSSFVARTWPQMGFAAWILVKVLTTTIHPIKQ